MPPISAMQSPTPESQKRHSRSTCRKRPKPTTLTRSVMGIHSPENGRKNGRRPPERPGSEKQAAGVKASGRSKRPGSDLNFGSGGVCRIRR